MKQLFAGGHGKVVEVDETVISRRKYNVGRAVEQQWFVTGVERDGKQCFIEPVEKRDAPTLNAIIQKYILPGTAIMTDGWAGYNGVTDLPEGYEHYVVNHSENFVNPEDSDIHTQNIESMHQKFKHRHKKEYGTARSKLVSYIEEYLWRRQFYGNDVLYHFWYQISEYRDFKCE